MTGDVLEANPATKRFELRGEHTVGLRHSVAASLVLEQIVSRMKAKAYYETLHVGGYTEYRIMAIT